MSGSRQITLIAANGQATAVHLLAYLDADAAEQAATESNQWIKSLRTADVDDATFRDRFTYRGDSLWWFAELFLHRQDVIADLWRVTLALDALCARERPARLRYRAGDPVLDLLVPQVAARHGVAHEREREPGTARRALALDADLKSRVYTWSALASRLLPRPAAAREADASPGGGTLVFVHSAFWRSGTGEEGYIGAVLRELQQRPEAQPVRLVGVGPRTNFKARRWWHPLTRRRTPAAAGASGAATTARSESMAPIVPVSALATWRQLAGSRRVWRERGAIERALLGSASLRERARVRGYDVWPIVRDELRGIARLQFPWSARAMDEAAAAIEAYRPARVLTYAEAGGWGRAIMLEARRRGVHAVGLQHGFIYRHWLNYLHAPDEMRESAVNPGDRGFPRPDLTLVYDGYAARHLRTEGRFPVESLRVTGSPGLDALVSAVQRITDADRARIRAALGAHESDALGIIVSKHTQIRAALPALAQAAATLPNLRLVIKPHPAETAGLYAEHAVAAVSARPEIAHATAASARPEIAHSVTVSAGHEPSATAAGRAGREPLANAAASTGPKPSATAAAGAASSSSASGHEPSATAARIVIAPASLDLASLLSVARLVITVNSTVAIDAMTLGIPSLIVLLPNNLTPFGQAGAMAAASDLATLPDALRALTHDDALRETLLTRASEFLRANQIESNGQASTRTVDAILNGGR